MKVLKYKNFEILRKISFIFIFFYFLSCFNYSNARISPYSSPASCSKDSQCSAIYGSGSCCMSDIYSNSSLFDYYSCISKSGSVASACPKFTGSVSNKCWTKDVCENGLDYAINGVSPANAVCGPATGFTSLKGTSAGVLSDSRITSNNRSGQFCLSGTLSSGDPKLNTAKVWNWTCSGQNGGTNINCSVKFSLDQDSQVNGVCFAYKTDLLEVPTKLCVSGVPGVVSLEDSIFSWVCSGTGGGASVSCSANAKAVEIVVNPETDPFADLSKDSSVTATVKDKTVQTEITSSYPDLEQPSANISSYNLLENYSASCSIKFDSECEVLDQKFLDVIKAKMSIKDAVDSGKLNGNMKVARIDFKTDTAHPKELDNYKTGLTLTNIQKLRKARVLPVGMELAALCIAGQIPCSNGLIYDDVSETNKDNCPIINDEQIACHRERSVLKDVTLNRILTGYSVCDPLSNTYSSKNDPFCHLVNPNWILKDPKYMCESGVKNGSLLYVTEKQSQSNIRYESCPDVSTCLSEKDSGECLSYGYCLREKNIWRFDLSADSCSNQNVGCAKYTYTMGGTKTTLGFISNTTDKSVCDQSNNGCRSYSLSKTGPASTDWSYEDADKIFLNNKTVACDSTQEGCTAFIRRDSANLIKNSSFEEYKLSSDLSTNTKEALFWTTHNVNPSSDYINLQTVNDSIPVYNGYNSLVIRRTKDSSLSSYTGYSLNKDYFVDVEPNKTYTLSYYILGYNTNFSADSISKYSQGAFVNIKEYDQSKKALVKKVCSSISSNLSIGSICNTDADCGTVVGSCVSATNNNIIDIDSLRYVNTFISSTWTRKTVSFKTSLDTYYLDVIPVLSNVVSLSSDPIVVVFDAIALQEGGKATTYALYEDSKINYLKKAPDYANCYSSSSNKDQIFCSNFIKACDKKDVGCRKYEKKDNSDYWLPGKPNENNYCTAECKGYQLYKESGPSYNPTAGATFQSFIATTAKSCSSGESGCSQYKNLSTDANEYFSSVRACVRENDDMGICSADKTKVCKADADCATGTCVKAKAQYADYFTYTGSETSGYKLNVYRLLRTKACSNDKSKCYVDSDCGNGNVCGYYDDVYAPATTISDSFDVCNETEYKKQNHNPDCREFHGPSNSTSAIGTTNGDYILYYANISEVIYASDENCSYYSIVPYQDTISKTSCDKISYLSPDLRYVTTTLSNNTTVSTCNIGIYIPESTVCSSDALNCREYNGTSISSESLFTDSFEDGDDGWKNGTVSPTISVESIFVNEHSVKIPSSSSISKIVVPDIIDPTEKALYKLRLYAKNDSSTGALSSIQLKVGTFTATKQVSNDWQFIGFDIFSSSDLSTVSNSIQIVNGGIVSGGGAANLFVDYISVEKSSSVYVIKDTWKTPVSCDNSIDNPTGVCNEEGVKNGFCKMVPDKVCLTGTNAGAVCTDATIAADCGNAADTCAYPNKICRWGDNKSSSCESDDDCYNNPNDPANVSVKSGSCFYTTNGYRLQLGQMIGCDEYIDSYDNDEFYVFNDLNLCNADKMGCEALYDTKNSKSYQTQQFNQDIDYSGVVAYYTFDDKNNIAKDDLSSVVITNNNNVVYSKDGVSSGAALFGGSNNISEVINNSLIKATSNISIYSWVRPTSFPGSIVSFDKYYDLSILPDGQIQCKFNNDNNKTLTSDTYKLSLNKWQNVLCTYDGDAVKIYVNGEVVASKNITSNIVFNYSGDTTSLFKIGNGFKGSIDDLRVYNKFFSSKAAFDSYSDYKDNYSVAADELGYYIIDSRYSCDAKYKGCVAVGRNEDRYNSRDFDFSTAYFVVDPDKFKASGNYATTGVYDAIMCKVEEEGCYSFKDSSSSDVNFKFPKKLCVYKDNVDVGIVNSDTNNSELQTGWFKYDTKNKVVSSEGCYYDDVLGTKTDAVSIKAAKTAPSSYKIVKSSDCVYKEDPVVVRRSFELSGTTITTRPKQTTYYIYNGTCSDNPSVLCSEDSFCSSGSCVLERTNTKCDSASNNPYCKPYGYDENPGVIDQFSNKSFEFNVCQSGAKVGDYCDSVSDCSGAPCGAPWAVVGWFKVNSTKGCSDDGDNVVESSDYIRDYNGSVGICNEYDCTNFVEPTEKKCVEGDLNGYECASDNDCGVNGVCTTDDVNGAKYCKAKAGQTKVNKLNDPCIFDKDCGFGGVCIGNNIYSYINNSKINSTGCNGKVSRESGCALFDDTSNPLLKFSSKLTYAGVKNGIAVAAITGDNSGGDSQKDSNLIIKVSRDRECAEWATFDNDGSPIKKDFDPSINSTANNISATCKRLSQDNKCLGGQTGNGWVDLNTGFYLGNLEGNWSDEDFSGMAIPQRASINRDVSTNNSKVYWWHNNSAGSNDFLKNLAVKSNVICKSYPETDSPFNFSDKYDIYGLTVPATGFLKYSQFKDLTPRDYFKNINSGITVPYKNSGENNYIKIDDKQDCYYKKVNYKDLVNPRQQYIGIGSDAPSSVCYNSTHGVVVNTDDTCDAGNQTNLESKVADYTDTKLKYKGYCAEYDYSHEIYYIGSGKYNCLTWIPGFMNN